MKRFFALFLVLCMTAAILPTITAAAAPADGTALIKEEISDEKLTLAPAERRVNTNSIAIDYDAEGGYEGDYVVIYNPATSSSTAYSTGNMSGLIDTTVSANALPPENGKLAADDKYIIDVDAMMQERMIAEFGENPVIPEAERAVSYNVGDTKTFKIYGNINSNTLVSIKFEVLYKGDHCYVWSPTSDNTSYPVALCPITSNLAQTAGEQFESKYQLMNDSFGAHNAGSGDGRVNILYYNINDGYNGAGGYIAGFFTGGDYQSSYNSLPILHIDSYPGVYGNSNNAGTDTGADITSCYSTMVHEYQHMIHYSFVGGGAATWSNEMMSAAAEELCYPGSSIFSRIMTYTNCPWTYAALADPNKEWSTVHANLHKGYSMYAWDNNIDDILALYAQVSLFSQYLYSRSELGNGVFQAFLKEFKKGKTFQTSCETVLGIKASDFVRDFRVALTANTSQDVLEGKYGFKLQPGYDPSNYYNVANPYNILGPIIYTASSCSIKGGGAITVKPVGGAYNPPADANANLRYYGIKLNAEGGDIGDEEQPAETGVQLDKQLIVESDGSFTSVISAYYAGESCPYGTGDIIFEHNSEYFTYLNRSISVVFYACTGIGADGKYTFAENSTSNAPGTSINVNAYNSGTLLAFSGFDFAQNAVTGAGQGCKMVITIKGIVFSDGDDPTFSKESGTYPANGNLCLFGIISGGYINSYDATIPDPHLTVGDSYSGYGFSGCISYSGNPGGSVVSINDRVQKFDQPGTSILGTSGAAVLSSGSIGFNTTSINIDTLNMMALLNNSDGTYEWTKLTFVPASNVLYEDDNPSIVYTDGASAWSVFGTSDGNAPSAGGVFGYSASYADDTASSNGTSHYAALDSTVAASVAGGASWPTAEFTFKGTGIDILSRCGADSGVIALDIVPSNETYSFSGANSRHVIVDTTLEHDAYGYLYQSPVYRCFDLAYGEYKVRLRAVYMNFGSAAGLDGIEYEFIKIDKDASVKGAATTNVHFDGIRVYNPLGTDVEAYSALNEYKPEYKTVKSLLNSGSALNIEFDRKNGTAVRTDYSIASPINEVYVNANSSVAFTVSGSYSAVHLGLKSPNGQPVVVKINGTPLTADPIRHATELYYDITALIGSGGSVSVTCELPDGANYAALLSLVTVKLIPSAASGNMLPSISASDDLEGYVEAINFGVMGDANRDKIVSVDDVLLTLRRALGTVDTLGGYGEYCADMDGNGRIDMNDCMAVLRSALGIAG